MKFIIIATSLMALSSFSLASVLPADYSSCQEDEYKGMTHIEQRPKNRISRNSLQSCLIFDPFNLFGLFGK
jgi:hypothetical protein